MMVRENVKAQLLAIYSPDKTASQMASEIGKTTAYVRATMYRNGLEFKRGPYGASKRRWQKIETAPRDGSEILVSNVKHVQIERWQESTMYTGWSTGTHHRSLRPSYWMPLPGLPIMGQDNE